MGRDHAGQDGQAGGGDHGGAGSLQEAKQDKRFDGRGQGQGHGGSGHHHGPADEYFFAAVNVGESSHRQQEKTYAEDVYHFNQAELHGIGRKFVAQRRQGHAHGRKHERGQKLNNRDHRDGDGFFGSGRGAVAGTGWRGGRIHRILSGFRIRPLPVEGGDAEIAFDIVLGRCHGFDWSMSTVSISG